jgi:hypothetical protein
MSEFTSIPEETPLDPMQGLLLTGEGVAALTGEHRALLRQMASALSGGLVVEMSVTTDLLSVSHALETVEGWGELAPDAVPATKSDFRDFAAEHRYTDPRATRTWWAIVDTAEWRQPRARSYRQHDPLPPIKIIDPEAFDPGPPNPLDMYPNYFLHSRSEEIVMDLRSVHARLAADWPMQRKVWDSHMTLASLGFLAHIVNEKVIPEELLPIDPRDFPPQQG